MKPKISIIIPVYNVEKYILECLESIVNQTIQDIEIIVINDGTEDNSIEIVKSINDKRIKIISQDNKGLSAARNTGLKNANGEYIAFVDSDDFILINSAYEKMYNIAKKDKSDIVVGNAMYYYSVDKKYQMKMEKEEFLNSPMKSEDYFVKCLETRRVYVPVWYNLYRTNLLKENSLYFKEGIYHEDEEFTPRVLLKAKNVSIYQEEFYAYRQRIGSIMNSKININKGLDVFNTCLQLDKLSENIQNVKLRRLFKRYLVYLILDQVNKYRFNKISSKIKWILIRNSNNTKLFMKAILINVNLKFYYVVQDIFSRHV